MKILIIGEYSGFTKNLKLGFEKLGHHVVVFQEGDSWKKIDVGTHSYNYSFCRNFRVLGREIPKSWAFRALRTYPQFLKDKSSYINYFDAALIINYEFIRLTYEYGIPRFSMTDIKRALHPHGKIYLTACGEDYAYIKYTPKFRYTPFTHITSNPYLRKRLKAVWEQVKDHITGVIPVMYDYAEAYRALQYEESFSLMPTIPLPIYLDDIEVSNIKSDKIVIFHGLNRASKGTSFILEALDLIKLKYADKVEVVVDGKLPLQEYIQLLRRTHIVIDQCYGYSYGMNALYSMAMGKVVLSGNEPECMIEFNQPQLPVINILPNTQDIVDKLEQLLSDPHSIDRIGKQSRVFVEQYHASTVVAQQYIDVFLK